MSDNKMISYGLAISIFHKKWAKIILALKSNGPNVSKK